MDRIELSNSNIETPKMNEVTDNSLLNYKLTSSNFIVQPKQKEISIDTTLQLQIQTSLNSRLDTKVLHDDKDISDTVKSEDLDENLNRTTLQVDDTSTPPSEKNNLIPN